ncbi:coat protein [uncultured Caudovirales phage]|uniref:Coat protein n=1 Tax=uncultured Caudovirales phage TaxID=2100421 RepID=A0A6J5PCE9_9CAUD|nr:coat protein [uncultured Caudovirales phage]
MANSFSKEERVAFENLLEGFQDALVLSRNVNIYNTDQSMMERTNNIIWRPQPYIANSYSGTDMTANFDDYTQLSVPATIGFGRSVPWVMTATELRDSLQEGRLGDAAKQKLASDINVAIMNVAALQGTLFVKRTGAASGFDDVAEIEAVMNERGIMFEDRYLALSTRDYNGMASDLSKASRSFGNDVTDTAYRRAYVGRVASFETFKLDYALRKAAQLGGAGLTVDTRASASNFYVPRATSVATTGETANVDNRFQTIAISSTTNVAAGDAFTIANVFAAHHITKANTGTLKTFRVISVLNSTQMVVSPPIISNQGGSDAEAQYQNVVVSATASNAPIVFLNTAAGNMNPFWQKDALEILPGRYAVPADAGAAVMRASTDQGIELVMTKQYDINTMKTKYRVDTLYGVVNKQPEMTGIIMFSQP